MTARAYRPDALAATARERAREGNAPDARNGKALADLERARRPRRHPRPERERPRPGERARPLAIAEEEQEPPARCAEGSQTRREDAPGLG